jgi:beta-glucosidase
MDMKTRLQKTPFVRTGTPAVCRVPEPALRRLTRPGWQRYGRLALALAFVSVVSVTNPRLSVPAAFAVDETCSACGQDVRVNGEFAHRKDNASVAITGATTDPAQYLEEINGKNFTVTIAHLPAGRYTITIGEVETLAGAAAGDRVFDVTAGDVSLARNFDIVVAAGGVQKVCTIKGTVEHQDDEIRGPINLVFSASKGVAKFNTVEIKDATGASVIAFNASALADNFSAEARRVPEIAGPVIWRDPTHPLPERINDLIRRMSLAEKVGQLQGGQTPAPAIARLGLPSYAYWNEALHGVANNGIATVFPEPVGGSCSWDPQLFHQQGTVIGIEGRAKFNDYASKNNGNSAWWKGLTFWTPNINIFRDPRWGRGQECYGEDPFLTGTIAVDFVKGIQGDDPNIMLAMACAKHYAVHSGPESLRHSYNAEPSARDLYETYLPQFEMAVREGHVGGVMGAYSALYGIPDCASPFLLTDLLRKQWGFEGYVVSDCGAIGDISSTRAHHYVNSPVEAAADAVKAGCNLTCGGEYNSLVRAVQQKLLTEKDVDQALYYTLWTRFKLGMFDPPDQNPYSKIGMDQNDTPEHRAVALKLAEESIVLLKNDGILPLNRSKIKRIAVIGPNASATDVLHGNYNGTASHPVTVLSGIRQSAGTNIEVTYAQGSPITTEVGRGFGGRGGGGFGGPLTADQTTQLDNSLASAQTDFTSLQNRLAAAQKDVITASLAKGDDNAVRAKLEEVAKIQTDIAVLRYTKGVHAIAASVTADQKTTINATPAPTYDAFFVSAAAAPAGGVGRGGRGGRGAAPTRPPAELQAEAISNAVNADLVIYVGGINPSQEGEQHDRTTIELPQVQEDLVQALYKTGKPVVMVNCSGSDVAFPWEAEHLPAILQAWYPGEAGGQAVGEILFGEVNPSGHLTVTFYRATTDLPAFTNYAMADRTYRYFNDKPLYAFGHGLSYTKFDFASGNPGSEKIAASGTAKVTFTVKNSGNVDGDEVAQVYFRHVNSAVPQPRLALCGFTRVSLKQGESKQVTVEVPAERLRYWDTEKKQYVVEPGQYEFLVGAASDDIRVKLPMTITGG